MKRNPLFDHEATGFYHKFSCRCAKCNIRAWLKIKPDVTKLAIIAAEAEAEIDQSN